MHLYLFDQLEGQLSKVLVTRDMEEKVRDKRSGRKTKTRGVRRFAAKKSKKYNAVDDNPENEMDEPDMADVDISRFPQPVAAFMTQYHTKKDIEKRLDEAHYWDLPEDDNIVLQIDQIVSYCFLYSTTVSCYCKLGNFRPFKMSLFS